MGWIVVALLLIAIVVFGYASGAQSYATAQQAQAQIEVAQVAQINAWGNLVTILAIVVLVLVVVGLVIAAIWFWWKITMFKRQEETQAAPRAITTSQTPTLDPASNVNLLVAMAILEKLDSWKSPQLPAPREDPPDDPLHWLK